MFVGKEYNLDQLMEWDKWNNVLVREHEPRDDTFHFRTDKDPSYYSWTGMSDCGMPAMTVLFNKPEMLDCNCGVDPNKPNYFVEWKY